MEDKSFTRVEKPAIIPEGWENNFSRHRTLVVEDDDDLRRFNAEALTGSGYQKHPKGYPPVAESPRVPQHRA